ncbi:hypothetical protein [Micromonospora sp. DT229]|uniref:hypothetical protein n=1 Tax=Micromonospora sp. DT229 TaxID=3393430 RepID=UPI003CEA268F
MNTKTLARLSNRRLVALGALALAAQLFDNRSEESFRFAGSVRDAHFLLSGHLHLWRQYPKLSTEDVRRISGLLLHRPGRLAILPTFRNTVTDLLTARTRPDGFALLGPDLFLVTEEARQELGELVDRIVRTLDSRREEADSQRGTETAREGHFRVATQIPDPTRPGNGVVQAHYVLDLVDTPAGAPLPDFGKPAELDEIPVPIEELETIADTLDKAYTQTYRRTSLDRLMQHLRTADGQPLSGGVLVLTAGVIQVLSACTGSGKSVLATLLALWGVKRGRVTSIVVPRNDSVMSFTVRLRKDLATLGYVGNVVPLISPNSMQKEAEKGASSHTEAGRGKEAAEVFGEFAYGCPLQAKSTNTQDVELWQPGEEPCTSLQGTDPETGSARRYRCPWHGHCGKHRQQTALADANIIVTSHINLMSGRIHIPVLADSRVRNSMTVEEAILHLSHLVLIDETDAFQATGFSKSAHHVALARYGGRRQTALQELDEQFRLREGQLMYELERYIHPKITQARFLSESYVSNAAHGRIAQGGPQDRNRQQLSRRRLILPRRWDAWCTGHLWRVPEGETPDREQVDTFRALFNPRAEASISKQERVPEIPDVADSRRKLENLRQALLAVTVLKDGEDPIFAGAHKAIAAALSPLLSEKTTTAADQTLLIDLMVRRAYLEQVRAQVVYMTRSGTSLQASGITAANELVEMLDDNKQWRFAPYGPLGEPVFGFTAAHDVEDKYRSELALTSFTGDPHAYTAMLGDTTALSLCGTRRIVVGLSATAHMPGGTMHHLIVPPTWYVPDDITGSLSLRSLILYDDKNEPVRISGSSDIRRDMAHQTMGRALWSHITQHLKKLASRPATAHRARILVACTSYLGAAQLAEGMVSAGADPEMIAVAVRAEDAAMPEHYRRKPLWAEIPSGSLERFPEHPSAKVLIAPLAIAERGLNMVDHQGRSLVGQVVLAVRPIPLMDEPAQLLALISSQAYSTSQPTDDPAGMLKSLGWTSTGVYEELFRTHHYFQSLPTRVRLSIVAEMLIGIIQLGGRVRRGGDQGLLYLADYAFHDSTTSSDLPRLIRDLRQQWQEAGQLDLLSSIYGNTLRAIFAFADEGHTH